MSQDQRMRQILGQMEVGLSYGGTQAFDKSGGKVKATGGERPQGDSSPVHELYRVLYERCSSAQERENVIFEAESEFERLRQQARPAVVEPGSLHWRREIARSEEPDKDICRVYSISRTTLWRYRRDYA